MTEAGVIHVVPELHVINEAVGLYTAGHTVCVWVPGATALSRSCRRRQGAAASKRCVGRRGSRDHFGVLLREFPLHGVVVICVLNCVQILSLFIRQVCEALFAVWHFAMRKSGFSLNFSRKSFGEL